jgi:small subunit ribosomal protein S6
MPQTAATRQWAREYETIYILRSNVDPDEAEKVVQRVQDVMKREGGTLTRVDNWGKRRLAYTIQGLSRGIFVYLRYVAFGGLVAELERNLRMLEPVIRYQTIMVRDMVDPASVQIDPEEVKFLRIEASEDDDSDEPTLEQRLAMAPREPREADGGGADGDSGMSDEEEEE